MNPDSFVVSPQSADLLPADSNSNTYPISSHQSTKPTIILVHGGWQSPSVFGRIVPRLERACYSVYAPALPSSNTIPAISSFDCDVQTIRHAIRSVIATGKEVVLVMHSYGAVPGCEALRTLHDDTDGGVTQAVFGRGGVIKLAFIAAMLLPVGGSTWKAERGDDAIPGFELKDNLIRVLDPQTRFYNDLSPADAACWASLTRLQSRPAYASKLTYAAYKYIPSSYLFATNDQALPLKVQERMAAAAGITETSSVKSGHSPHLSQPKSVELFIRRSAGEVLPAL